MKYALLIGIGYVNTRHALEGPLRDVYLIKETLADYDCTVITDHTETIPTKKVIQEAFYPCFKRRENCFFITVDTDKKKVFFVQTKLF